MGSALLLSSSSSLGIHSIIQTVLVNTMKTNFLVFLFYFFLLIWQYRSIGSLCSHFLILIVVSFGVERTFSMKIQLSFITVSPTNIDEKVLISTCSTFHRSWIKSKKKWINRSSTHTHRRKLLDWNRIYSSSLNSYQCHVLLDLSSTD